MPIYKAPENIHSVSVGGREYKVNENGYIETAENIGNAVLPLGFTVASNAVLDAEKAKKEAQEVERLAQEAKDKEEAEKQATELKKAEEAQAKAEADKAKKAEADAKAKADQDAKAAKAAQEAKDKKEA